MLLLLLVIRRCDLVCQLPQAAQGAAHAGGLLCCLPHLPHRVRRKLHYYQQNCATTLHSKCWVDTIV